MARFPFPLEPSNGPYFAKCDGHSHFASAAVRREPAHDAPLKPWTCIDQVHGSRLILLTLVLSQTFPCPQRSTGVTKLELVS